MDRKLIDTPRRFLMQSNGGVMPLAANAESQTVHTLLSGPAAGVQATAWLVGKSMEIGNIVTLDMGGQAPIPLSTRVHWSMRGLCCGTNCSRARPRCFYNFSGWRFNSENKPQDFLSWPSKVVLNLDPSAMQRWQRAYWADADLVCGFLNPDLCSGRTGSILRRRDSVFNEWPCPWVPTSKRQL